MKTAKGKRSSPVGAFRKDLARWKSEGRKLQSRYKVLHKGTHIEHIALFEPDTFRQFEQSTVERQASTNLHLAAARWGDAKEQ
jgi:hypothetical protein